MPQIYIAKHTHIVALAVCCVIGCNGNSPTDNVGRVVAVPYSESLQPLVGTWESEGKVALIVEHEGSELTIQVPEKEYWRVELADATVSDDRVQYVQRNYLRRETDHPFSGLAINCTISPIPGDPDGLEIILTAEDPPQSESGIYRRAK